MSSNCLLGKGLCPNVFPAPVGKRRFLLNSDGESPCGLEAREGAGAQVTRGGWDRGSHTGAPAERTALSLGCFLLMASVFP